MEAESPEAGGVCGAVSLEFPAGDRTSLPVKIPQRIRRRLLESRSGSPPSSVEEIEAKLKEADLRRRQFLEWLSSKARPKPRSPSWSSSQDEDLGQRLDAKLYAAEQKRLSLLAKAQMRLAKLDELRHAAKTCVEMRYEKEREELGSRVEFRVQQAEANRKRLLKAHMQRRAAAEERTARLLMQRMIRENKYKEHVWLAMFQKRVAAEKKRMRLLEEEKTRVHARVMRVHRAAKTVYHQRESERRKMKEQLENRLQRARRQRAEFLRQRGNSHSSAHHIIWNKHGDCLSRKLAKCWRRFVGSRRTTFALVKSFEALGINEKAAKTMRFEQLALRMESATTLQAVKALLDRLESRFLLSQSSASSSPENIDHLLKRIASPSKRTPPSRASRIGRGTPRKGPIRENKCSDVNKPSRYPVRVVLCAYMILGHPNAVFSGQGEREVTLRESAAKFVQEFELLIKIILDGGSSRQSSPDYMCNGSNDHQECSAKLPTFKSQLSAFDAAWRSYLYCFVVWKVKDARTLEDDLIRAACQLELSMMQTCKLTAEGQTCDLTHDMRAVQKQVSEDHKLLREKVQHLSGSDGIQRMESALSDTRSKFFEGRDHQTPPASLVAQISVPSTSSSSVQPLEPVSKDQAVDNSGRSNRVVRSLFGGGSSSSPIVGTESQEVAAQLTTANGKLLPTENELMVNEIVHGGRSTLFGNDGSNIQAKVRETLEKAFWDEIMDSLNEDSPDYSRILGLVKEVRDELNGMAPQSWKQEILDNIDLDILSQLLMSGTQDTEYLGRILEYALAILRKLSAPAKEDEMNKAHEKLLTELACIGESNGKVKSSFIIAVVKGLRFVLEETQELKKEVSKARIQMLEPIIKGSAGLEYLQKAFADRYGPPPRARGSLPLMATWISSLVNNLDEEWDEHTNSVSLTSTNQGVPIVTTLRTGGSIPPLARSSSPPLGSDNEEQPGCHGEKLDLLLRLGLLKIASGIEGLTNDTVPETLELNVLRLRSVQNKLQQIIVISTSMLVLRQILLSENLATSASELETIIYHSCKRLTDLLDSVPDVGIEDIIDSIISSSPETKLQNRRDLITRVLTGSLQSGDAVFSKVSRSIYLATRAVVLGGSGDKGRKLADATLKRVGATALLDQVVKAAKVLIIVATISGYVHGAWYRSLI